MSDQQLKDFLQAVAADPELQKRLENVSDIDSLVILAKEAGFALSVDHAKKGYELMSEVSEQALERIAGGSLEWVVLGAERNPWFNSRDIC